MKSIQHKTSPKRTIVAIIAAAIVLMLGLLVYVYGFDGEILEWKKASQTKQSNEDYKETLTPPTDNELTAGSKQKEETVNLNGKPNQPTDTSKANDSFTASITATNQDDETLQIRTLIEEVTSQGSCDLQLVSGSQRYIQSVEVYPLPNSSTCKGFDIPLTNLSSGDWNLTITITLPSGIKTLTKDLTIT